VIKIERRLDQPRWLSVAVPVGSLAFAFLVMAVVLLVTGHDPIDTYRRLFNAAFVGSAAWTATLMSATPLLFTGLAAATAFRMNLFNIGAEGQLYLGAVCSLGIAIWLGPGVSTAATIVAMCVCGAAGGALWALIPGALKAFARTNEIITTLMLNYVAGQLLTYLIFDSASPWRDLSTIQTRSFPQSIALKPSQFWPTLTPRDIVVPFGFLLAIGVALGLWVLFRRTRFGFEMSVIGDSNRAARYSGMRTRRKILAVMGLSGAVAGLAERARWATSRTCSTRARRGSRARPSATRDRRRRAWPLQPLRGRARRRADRRPPERGPYLQGPDFPTGLVGVLQGIILFCTLGGEILIRYRVRFVPRAPQPVATEAATEPAQ
jgi:simple sugar transport system permease protein